MKTLPLRLSAVVLLCCAAAFAVAAPPHKLRYTLDLHDLTHIHVTLELAAYSPGSEILLLPSQWAGQAELYRAVSALQTTTPGASLSPTSNPARWLLRIRRAGPVTVTYTLAQDWSGPLRHPFEHRAILDPAFFEFTGENGLVVPASSVARAVDITFDLVGLPTGEIPVTSFGDTPHQNFIGPWSAVRNALFTGGDLTIHTLDIEGHPILLAMHGPWGFPRQQIDTAVQNILFTERHLWNDPAPPYFAIVIAPYDDTTSGGSGSAFTNAASVFLSDRETFTADTASLLAHEAFHHWNPDGLGEVDDTEQIAWFGEGFTRFYQDIVLERAGLLNKAGYLARLNATVRDYFLSPRIHATNLDLQQLPSPDLFAFQEPYLRGAMIALWLSSEIDRQSSGRHTLLDLMLTLRAGHSEPLTDDRIFATAGRFVDPATVARLRAFALGGETVPIPSGSLGECIAFNNQPAWTFDLGFDAASLHRSGVVQGVQQGSNAYQAGVRDGQELGGFALWNGNPEREVTLTLRDADGKRERLTFLPRGKLLSIPQAEQIPGCPKGPRIPE